MSKEETKLRNQVLDEVIGKLKVEIKKCQKSLEEGTRSSSMWSQMEDMGQTSTTMRALGRAVKVVREMKEKE